jgi:hypothetical protein
LGRRGQENLRIFFVFRGVSFSVEILENTTGYTVVE